MNKGPTVSIELSCFDCDFCTSESYKCQGDSGSDVYCIHTEAVEIGKDRRRVGDTRWTTPDWCPLRQAAIEKTLAGIGYEPKK